MWSDFWRCTRLMYSMYLLSSSESETNVTYFEKCAKACGVSGIKLMQFLMMHDGFLSSESKSKLKHVLDQCETHEWKHTANMYEKAFGNDIHDDFDITRDDKVPIGSGSIGQVYKLKHRETGKYVALKIKHPGVDEQASRFVSNISYILSTVECVKKIPFSLFIREFLASIHSQLDYGNEAAHTEQMRRNFNTESHIIIPEVYKASNDILIMSYHDGIAFNEITDQKLRMQVATDIYLFMVSSFINYDLLHCDMHYGNWKVHLENDAHKIIVYDFGMISKSNKSSQTNKQIVFATFKGNFSEIFEVLSPEGSSDPKGEMLLQYVKDMQKRKYNSSCEKFADFVKTALQCQVHLDADVLRCVQGIVTCMSIISMSTNRLLKILGEKGSCMEVLMYYNYLLLRKLNKYKAFEVILKDWIDADPSIQHTFLQWLDDEYGHQDADVFIDVVTSKHLCK